MKDKAKRKSRSRITNGQDFEARHLAETADISEDQARELLQRHGNDWAKLKDAAKSFKPEN
jgi:hypothetical protein